MLCVFKAFDCASPPFHNSERAVAGFTASRDVADSMYIGVGGFGVDCGGGGTIACWWIEVTDFDLVKVKA